MVGLVDDEVEKSSFCLDLGAGLVTLFLFEKERVD